MLNSFLIAMLLATMILLVITRLAAERLIHQHHGQKKDFFHTHPILPGDIVFLGDSLTDGARWDELFPGMPVKNRGINADLTNGVLTRLGQIVTGHPAAIFILIGTNDLPWYEYRSDRSILATYHAILAQIRCDAPQTDVYVQSIFPRSKMYAPRIIRLNSELKRMSNEFGCTFIDLYSKLVDTHGSLRPEITNDGLHLLAAGYQIWVNAIKPYMDQYIQPGSKSGQSGC
jgi:lysophospholipase L1-like esterase